MQPLSLGPWFSLEGPLGIPIPPFPLYFFVLLTWKRDEALLLEVNFMICGIRLLAFTQPPKTLPGSAPPAAVPRNPSRWHCDPDHPQAPVVGLGTQTLVRPGEAPRGRTSPLRTHRESAFPERRVLLLLHSLPGPF